MSSSATIKTETMCWLRYGKRMNIVASEVGRWNSDVLGLSDKMSIEVEVKVSKSDLVREFSSKQTKHYYYANAGPRTETVPNYLYFAVPEVLEAVALEILKEKAPKAGLVLHTDTNLLAGRNVRVAKKPTRLREGPPSPALIRTAMARMSSELCGSKQALDQVREHLLGAVDRVEQSIVSSSYRVAGALDCESEPSNIEHRAAELAFCVEGLTWTDVSDRDKWREAARKWLDCQFLDSKNWTIHSYR